LRFYAQWDDRGSMFGQKLDYVINYFLQDDKIEVRPYNPYPELAIQPRVKSLCGYNPV
jgi:hypothetical protein